jgi:hypothetical protein
MIPAVSFSFEKKYNKSWIFFNPLNKLRAEKN